MIGVEARGIRISVQHLPDRKRPSLCIEYFSKPAEIYLVGSFNSEENAARFRRGEELINRVYPRDVYTR